MRGLAAVDRSLIGRLALGVVLLVTLATNAACATSSQASHEAPSGQPGDGAPSGSVQVLPAYEAGGACQLLDYDTIQRTIGLSFSVAAAAQRGETYTCLVQQRGISYPDLALSVSSTIADEKALQTAWMPKGAAKVEGLGKIAYSVPISAASGAGPGAQVGWLSGNKRLLILRVRFAPGTADQAAETIPGLIALAQVIDFISS
ncbi:MAG: hypothetical protein JXA67_22480 [Micromonosporaceae bacterium]|nr:hypothetical protein [Micromonosporaceae bacterium]